MSVHSDMEAWVRDFGQKMDDKVRASSPPGVSAEQLQNVLEVHGMIRQCIAGPLLSHLDSLEQALSMASKQVVELIGRLTDALEFLEFFPDLLSSDGAGVYVTVESAKDAAAWRAETAAWIEAFVENIKKSSDGQGD